jgi:hypothetical protein
MRRSERLGHLRRRFWYSHTHRCSYHDSRCSHQGCLFRVHLCAVFPFLPNPFHRLTQLSPQTTAATPTRSVLALSLTSFNALRATPTGLLLPFVLFSLFAVQFSASQLTSRTSLQCLDAVSAAGYEYGGIIYGKFPFTLFLSFRRNSFLLCRWRMCAFLSAPSSSRVAY